MSKKLYLGLGMLVILLIGMIIGAGDILLARHIDTAPTEAMTRPCCCTSGAKSPPVSRLSELMVLKPSSPLAETEGNVWHQKSAPKPLERRMWIKSPHGRYPSYLPRAPRILLYATPIQHTAEETIRLFSVDYDDPFNHYDHLYPKELIADGKASLKYVDVYPSESLFSQFTQNFYETIFFDFLFMSNLDLSVPSNKIHFHVYPIKISGEAVPPLEDETQDSPLKLNSDVRPLNANVSEPCPLDAVW